MHHQILARCKKPQGCQTTCSFGNQCRRSRRGCLPCWSKSRWCLAPHSRQRARIGSCWLPPPRRRRCTHCQTCMSHHPGWRRSCNSSHFRWCILQLAHRSRQSCVQRGCSSRFDPTQSTHCLRQSCRRWSTSLRRSRPEQTICGQGCGPSWRQTRLPHPIQNQGLRSSRPRRQGPQKRSRRLEPT